MNDDDDDHDQKGDHDDEHDQEDDDDDEYLCPACQLPRDSVARRVAYKKNASFRSRVTSRVAPAVGDRRGPTSA